MSDEQGAKACIEEIQMAKDVGIPAGLKELGERRRSETLAENALKDEGSLTQFRVLKVMLSSYPSNNV